MAPVIHLYGLELSVFGTMLTIGLAVVHLLLWIQARYFGYSFSKLHALTLVAFIGGSLGARFFNMIIVENDLSFSAIVQISEGTFFYGFLIGLLISCSIYYKYFTSDTCWKELDIAAPAWLALQIAGRIGCFLAGCCYGTHTDLPWGATYHAPLSQAPQNMALHPTQLYEAGIILLILCHAFAKRGETQFAGYTFFRILLLYSVARFFLEFLRDDERGTLLGGLLSISQGISLLLASAVLILRKRGGRVSRSTIRPFIN